MLVGASTLARVLSPAITRGLVRIRFTRPLHVDLVIHHAKVSSGSAFLTQAIHFRAYYAPQWKSDTEGRAYCTVESISFTRTKNMAITEQSRVELLIYKIHGPNLD